MKYDWVAYVNGIEVARGKTIDEARGLALIAGHAEEEVTVGCELSMPEVGDLPRGEFDVMYHFANACYARNELPLMVRTLEGRK